MELYSNNKEGKDTKVTSIDGMLIEEETKEPVFNSSAEKALLERTKKLITAPEKNPGAIIIKGSHDISGVRAENGIPKVESMSITTDTLK
jgi:hypothetical protein